MMRSSKRGEITTGIMAMIVFFSPVWVPAVLVVIFGWMK
jgi:hypothetical protein